MAGRPGGLRHRRLASRDSPLIGEDGRPGMPVHAFAFADEISLSNYGYFLPSLHLRRDLLMPGCAFLPPICQHVVGSPRHS
jgi:hypothetical protein